MIKPKEKKMYINAVSNKLYTKEYSYYTVRNVNTLSNIKNNN